MKKDFSGLTGKKLLHEVGRRNRKLFFTSLFGTVMSLVLAYISVPFMRDTGSYFSGIFVLLLGLGLAVGVGRQVPRHLKTMLHSGDSPLFQTHGSPDEIAGMISEEYILAQMDEEGTMVCPSFIMMRRDYETFIRYDKVRFASLLVFQKYGAPVRLYLDITDTAGKNERFPIRLNHQEEAEEALRRIKEIARI